MNRCDDTGKPKMTSRTASAYAGTRNQIKPDSHTFTECRHCRGWHVWRFADWEAGS